ncbi:CRISPR-associated protein, Cse3 family [Rhizobiales bacterium GAS191]|nr:CRISPR-associated protein, Cse3 family [Rhizobiales bacterium GAS191]
MSHRLVWSLFPEELKERPFLYRDTAPPSGLGRAGRGEFLILSRLPPDDRSRLFDLETKPFEPVLQVGDRLGFSLRANPTVHSHDKDETTSGGKKKTRRYDVVMHSLHALPEGTARAEARPLLIREAGLRWLTKQGEAAGFKLPAPQGVSVEGYEQFEINPGKRYAIGDRRRRPGHSRLDFDGVLEVTDPALFLARLATGFGRARAFGHGLMLIRRA